MATARPRTITSTRCKWPLYAAPGARPRPREGSHCSLRLPDPHAATWIHSSKTTSVRNASVKMSFIGHIVDGVTIRHVCDSYSSVGRQGKWPLEDRLVRLVIVGGWWRTGTASFFCNRWHIRINRHSISYNVGLMLANWLYFSQNRGRRSSKHIRITKVEARALAEVNATCNPDVSPNANPKPNPGNQFPVEYLLTFLWTNYFLELGTYA